ncbi:MAG: hypothetical protein ACI4UM_00665 [Succinivibrio sp.]
MSISLISKASVEEYSEYITDSGVEYENADGTSRASLSLIEPRVNLSTTKDYAQYLMDSYQGWGLSPVIDLRGFSFKYVDNGPCSGLVTYFDGRSYLLFKACGNVQSDDLKALFKKANRSLKLDELLKRQSKANLY